MVTASAIAASSSHLLGRVDGLLTLRVRSPEHRGRVVRIRSPKCVVGSHPSCTLRLRGAGVRPFHCLILRGEAGTFIRRLSAETCLNGAGFTDTRLTAGDRLAIGPIELEVLESTGMAGRDWAIGPDSARDATSDPSRPDQPATKDRDLRGPLESEPAELRDEQLHLPQVGDRELIDELRQALATAQQRQEADSAEKEQLTRHAADAEERAGALEMQRSTLQQELDELRAQSEAAKTLVASELQQCTRQLTEARRQAEEQQNQWQQRRQDWETTQTDLLGQLDQHRKELDEATRQLEATRFRAGELESLLREAAHQAAEATGSVGPSSDEWRRREEESRALQRQLGEQRRELESRQGTCDKQRHELDEQRRALDEERRELESRQGTCDKQRHELDEQRRALDEGQGTFDKQRQELDEQRRALDEERRELEEQLHKQEERRQESRRQHEQWKETERQLRDQLQAANDRLQETTNKCGAAESRLTELEVTLAEASEQLKSHRQTGRDTQRERDESVAELSKWRDSSDRLREELQQEREQHQRARNEWHVDRESLERELAERTEMLENFQKAHNQDMEEAEYLIHSLQQEGKQLLAQLDEAKQVIRHDIERRKKRPPATSGQLTPGTAASSATQTMPMAGRFSGENSPAPHALDVEPDDGPEEPSVPGGWFTRNPEPVAEPESVAEHPADHRLEPADEIQPAEQHETPECATSVADVHESSASPTVMMPTLDAVEKLEVPESDVPHRPSDISSREPVPDESPTMVLDPSVLQVEMGNMGPVEAIEALVGVERGDRADGATGSGAAELEGADDDGVIQRYMERLLKRVASQGREGVEEAVAADVRPAATPRQESVGRKASKAVAAELVDAKEAADHADHADHDQPPTVQEYVAAEAHHARMTRWQAHEKDADLLAMRRLANDSARQAITNSDRRRIITRAAGELFVASVCLGCGGMVIAMSAKTLSVQGVGGLVGLYFGTVMALRGVRKLWSVQRIGRVRPDSSDPNSSDPVPVAAGPVETDHDVADQGAADHDAAGAQRES